MTTKQKVGYIGGGIAVIAVIIVGILWARGLGKPEAAATPSPTPSPLPKPRGLGNDRFGPHPRIQTAENVDVGVRTVNTAGAPSASPSVRQLSALPYSPIPVASPMTSPAIKPVRPVATATPEPLPDPPTFTRLAPPPAAQIREAVVVYAAGQVGKRQIYLRSLERDKNEQLVTSVFDDYGVSFSSSNQKVAFYSNEEGLSDASRPRSKLKVVDLATGKVTTIASNLPGIEPAAWSPNGRYLAIPTTRSIFIANVTTGTALQVPTGHNPGGISWSGDNLTFYYHAEVSPENTDIYRADTVTAQTRPVVTGPADEKYPSTSADGSKLTFLRTQGSGGSDAVVVRPVGGGEDKTYTSSQSAEAFLWNLDFSTLVVSQRKEQLNLVTIQDTTVKTIGNLANPIVVAWDRDYQHVFVLADDNDGKSLFTVDIGSGETEKVKSDIASPASVPTR